MSHAKVSLVALAVTFGLAFGATASPPQTTADPGVKLKTLLATTASIRPTRSTQSHEPHTTLHTTQKSYSCSPVGPDPGFVEAHCVCYPGTKTCAQFSTVGMYASNVCKKCETDFVEFTAKSDLQQVTNVGNCMVQSQVGENMNAGKSFQHCGLPLTSTIDGTVFVWPGQTVTRIHGLAGTKTTTGAKITAGVGSSTPISTIAPTITAISGFGPPDATTQGAWVGPMTGSDLWFNISSAVQSACTGGPFPLTTCAEPVITGVPYPSGRPDPGLMPALDYGEMRINLNSILIKDDDELSTFAYYLGMNAAAAIKRMGEDACKKLHTNVVNYGGRAGLTQSAPEPLMGCFMPSEFLLIQEDMTQSGEPNSLMWSQFYFTGEHGQDAGLQCKAVDSVVNGILAVVMAALALIPGAGGAISKGVGEGAKAGVKAGSAEAKGLGIRAVQMGEAIKFGCKSIKGDDPGNGDDLSSGGNVSDDDSFGLMNSLLGDDSGEDSDLERIGRLWETISNLIG